MIDAELIVSQYLQAALATRVVGRTPSNTSGTWITLTQLDARAVGDHRSDHFVDYLLQLDVYAGGRPELWPLAHAARAAMRGLPGVRTATGPDDETLEAVVTGVVFSGMARIPDTDFEPARERVVLTASVYAHPVG